MVTGDLSQVSVLEAIAGLNPRHVTVESPAVTGYAMITSGGQVDTQLKSATGSEVSLSVTPLARDDEFRVTIGGPDHNMIASTLKAGQVAVFPVKVLEGTQVVAVEPVIETNMTNDGIEASRESFANAVSSYPGLITSTWRIAPKATSYVDYPGVWGRVALIHH